MGLEIERRFIVKGNEWKSYTQNSQELKQGYLKTDKNGWTIRVRVADNKNATITLKHPKEMLTRYEFEYSIPINDAQTILEFSKYSIIKTRYELNFQNILWIVDCFKDENFPLVLAEIELKTKNQIFKKPKWCGLEVSNSQELSNAALAKYPFSTWPLEKRHVFL